MKAMKIQATNTAAYKPKGHAVSPVKPIVARRGAKARSVVDATFAAVAIRKHAKIELLIDQVTDGD